MDRRNQTIDHRPSTIDHRQSAFTLIELLVVIGIIAILVSIVIPVVSRVKLSAQEASTRAIIQGLEGAITRYQADFKAYPGPFSNNQIRSVAGIQGGQVPGPGFANQLDTSTTATAAGFANTAVDRAKVTGAENLVLGLCGGLKIVTGSSSFEMEYDPATVGQGPMSLNPANPKRFTAYIDTKNVLFRLDNGLKTGKFEDEGGAADDTAIPEFVDAFTSAGEMPILYIRARVGAKFSPSNATDPPNRDNNGVANAPSGTPNDSKFPQQQYDVDQIIAYTGTHSGRSIGQGKSVRKADYTDQSEYTPVIQHGLRDVENPLRSLNKTLSNGSPDTNYKFPYDAYPYLLNPTQPNTARNKDGYILISAGRDRVYGTNDDITNFGPVK